MQYKYADSRYTALVETIRDHFKQSHTLIWDRRNKIKVLAFLEEEVVVKAFKVPHMINRIAYTFFRDSKAKRSYDNSCKLEAYTPRPIAYVEYKKFGLLNDSYFISARYPYDFTIREVLTQENFSDREQILKAFAAFTYRLHELDVEHLDYSPGNILIKRMPEGYEFKVIDVNRMRFGTMDMKKRFQSFSKLWAHDKDLETIVSSYAKIMHADEKEALRWAREASSQHKAKVNMKKRLKGKPVVD